LKGLLLIYDDQHTLYNSVNKPATVAGFFASERVGLKKGFPL